MLGQIVDKDSAVLRLPNEVAVGVAQSNHKMMCKFEAKESQKYKPVWLSIKALAESALSAEASSASKVTQQDGEVQGSLTLVLDRSVESFKAIFSVPFPQDKGFIDRKPIFSQIDTGFLEGRPVALCGIGGIGYGISEPPCKHDTDSIY